MAQNPKLIKVNVSPDDRGEITHCNDFNFLKKDLKRFYKIENHKLNFIRAWHAHKNEQKYILILSGSLKVSLVKIDNWKKPSKKNKVYNLGSGKKIQFDELIYKISKVLNKDQELVINELDGTPGDMLGCIADIDEIKNDTAFNPETSIEEGLIKMYQSVL